MKDYYEQQWDQSLKEKESILIRLEHVIAAYGVEYAGPLDNFALHHNVGVRPAPAGLLVLSRN